MMKKNINVTLIGPQGSGKGTQASLLADKYSLAKIEIGGSLREIIKTKSPLGKKIDEIINQKGNMVPFELVIKVVQEKIKKIPDNQGIIFDGTPRRMEEIKPLEKLLADYQRELTHIFYIKLSKEESVRRLEKRRMCQNCGAIFISGKNIDPKEKKCPFCQGNIIQRKDDRPEAIKQRLSLFHQRTMPVVEYYKEKGKLIEINGEQSIENVFKEINKYIK